MENDRKRPRCECKWLQRAVLNEQFPISYDHKMGEYQLVLDCGALGNGFAVLRYCPSCGGALPNSEREASFTVPTDSDESRVCDIMKAVKSVAQMYDVLGQPADRVETNSCVQYTYDNLCSSLDLVIFQHKEHISHLTHGKQRP